MLTLFTSLAYSTNPPLLRICGPLPTALACKLAGAHGHIRRRARTQTPAGTDTLFLLAPRLDGPTRRRLFQVVPPPPPPAAPAAAAHQRTSVGPSACSLGIEFSVGGPSSQVLCNCGACPKQRRRGGSLRRNLASGRPGPAVSWTAI